MDIFMKNVVILRSLAVFVLSFFFLISPIALCAMSPFPIDGTTKTQAATPIRGAAKGGSIKDKGFAQYVTGGEDDVTGVLAPSAASSVSGILGLQEVGDALSHRSRGLKQAQALLDTLEEIHRALVDGRLSLDTIRTLANLADGGVDDIEDARLRDLVWSIDLRANVELAKMTFPLDSQSEGNRSAIDSVV